MQIQLKHSNQRRMLALIGLIGLVALALWCGLTAVQVNASALSFETNAPAATSNSTTGTPNAPLTCLLPDSDVPTNALGVPLDCPGK